MIHSARRQCNALDACLWPRIHFTGLIFNKAQGQAQWMTVNRIETKPFYKMSISLVSISQIRVYIIYFMPKALEIFVALVRTIYVKNQIIRNRKYMYSTIEHPGRTTHTNLKEAGLRIF